MELSNSDCYDNVTAYMMAHSLRSLAKMCFMFALQLRWSRAILQNIYFIYPQRSGIFVYHSVEFMLQVLCHTVSYGANFTFQMVAEN